MNKKRNRSSSKISNHFIEDQLNVKKQTINESVINNDIFELSSSLLSKDFYNKYTFLREIIIKSINENINVILDFDKHEDINSLAEEEMYSIFIYFLYSDLYNNEFCANVYKKFWKYYVFNHNYQLPSEIIIYFDNILNSISNSSNISLNNLYDNFIDLSLNVSEDSTVKEKSTFLFYAKKMVEFFSNDEDKLLLFGNIIINPPFRFSFLSVCTLDIYSLNTRILPFIYNNREYYNSIIRLIVDIFNSVDIYSNTIEKYQIEELLSNIKSNDNYMDKYLKLGIEDYIKNSIYESSNLKYFKNTKYFLKLELMIEKLVNNDDIKDIINIYNNISKNNINQSLTIMLNIDTNNIESKLIYILFLRKIYSIDGKNVIVDDIIKNLPFTVYDILL